MAALDQHWATGVVKSPKNNNNKKNNNKRTNEIKVKVGET